MHGLGANPDTTWTATLPPTEPASTNKHDKTQKQVCWVTDLWIDDIPAAVRRKTRIFFYNHDSGWRRDGVQARLSTLAGRLLHELCGMTQVRQPEAARRGNGMEADTELAAGIGTGAGLCRP